MIILLRERERRDYVREDGEQVRVKEEPPDGIKIYQ
jgi:hypothetical protein